MKLAIFSDLHIDFHRDYGRSLIDSLNKDADVAVVAGDVAAYHHFRRGIVDICAEYPKVVYVAGNHSYYEAPNFDQVNDILSDLEVKLGNFVWLNNRRVAIDGVNFIGATLWFKRTQAALINKPALNDFRYIPNCDPRVFDEYERTVKYFEAEMQVGDIVVTHHSPSYKSISPQYKNSDINCYFANRLDSLVIDKKPKYWFFGHTHSCCDFMIDNTRLVANPFGYPSENPMFNDSLVVEV
jgi:predicted phosphodiesterase